MSDLLKFLKDFEGLSGKSKSLKDLMNKYDIKSLMEEASSWKKSNNVYLPATYTTLNPFSPMPAMAAYYQYFINSGITTLDEAEKLAMEKKKKVEKFEKIIDSLTKKPVKKIDNPNNNAERTPDYVHTLTAWRGWGIKGRKLSSIGTVHGWQPRVKNSAFCATYDHDAPDMKCQCGYWGFHSYELMKEALHPYIDKIDVVGTIEIWGKVIECENGYRAEYAYPKELWLLRPDLEYLSWIYDVPIKQMGDML